MSLRHYNYLYHIICYVLKFLNLAKRLFRTDLVKFATMMEIDLKKLVKSTESIMNIHVAFKTEGPCRNEH